MPAQTKIVRMKQTPKDWQYGALIRYGLLDLNDLIFILDMAECDRPEDLMNLYEVQSYQMVILRCQKIEKKLGAKLFVKTTSIRHNGLNKFSYHGVLVLEIVKKLLAQYISALLDMEAITSSMREVYGELVQGVYKERLAIYDPNRVSIKEQIAHVFHHQCFKEIIMAKAKPAVEVKEDGIEGQAPEGGDAAPQSDNPTAERKPRATPRPALKVSRFVFAKDHEGKLAPQAQLIMKHVKAAGDEGITREDLCKALTSDAEFTTRQPVERIVGYYQRPLVENGFLVGA